MQINRHAWAAKSKTLDNPKIELKNTYWCMVISCFPPNDHIYLLSLLLLQLQQQLASPG